jgi:hypothetical protein
MNSFLNYARANWKTNLASLCAFAYSVPEFVAAIKSYEAHQHTDWRSAIFGLILAAGLAMAKDGTNHSTVAQVESATIKADAAQLPKS